MFVLHAGERQQVVAAEVARVFEAHAQRAHEEVGGGGAGFAAAHQFHFHARREFRGQVFRRQQHPWHQAHRPACIAGIGHQRLGRHVAFMGAEGHHAARGGHARNAPGQFFQRGEHGETGPEQFDAVEQGAGQGEARGLHAGQQGAQVVGHQGRQRLRLVPGQFQPGGHIARGQFQRQDGGAGDQRLVHGRFSERQRNVILSSGHVGLFAGRGCGLALPIRVRRRSSASAIPSSSHFGLPTGIPIGLDRFSKHG